ncbi:adenosylcobalamin-dependent ribonucleoside-diphosphate reductase [Rhodopila globiformis]|uniref:Vitamin B12-dependent ribonucleotide reductase n=1 Tax=Rhodopila globiformis TaxID=1071 RepID=A0A2S6MZY0_RHOGL|nr:adenosylcobalamin-dependent ribonucleoside-diphosphate reductase [Rhodopila globiformis]PPQ27896.1 ribonucleoside-diphosphate reductase, adenosylcobalamin-dependent [Rhodopila globiformis]
MPAEPPLDTPVARHLWQARYRAGAAESGIDTSWRRVAHALARIETARREEWENHFLDILQGFRFLPGGRILAGAGTGEDVTLLNCFVMGTIDDSVIGIFRALERGALTMQHGGGVGYDFSTLRPSGFRARKTGGIASGPVSFMDVWDTMCATIQSAGVRRGAMMATLHCNHPDILAFVDAKRDPRRLRHFNLSVLVTDAFMRAVAQDEPWPLAFPDLPDGNGGETIWLDWPGEAGAVRCRVARRLPARDLADRLARAGYESGEPGVLFIDRINRMNNLWYCERIAATNPCGEVPLPPYGACCLGSINLARLVRDPFSLQARLDTDRLAAVTATAVRLLDNVLDATRFPLAQQRHAARRARRVGLGITGLADVLLMLGIRYGSDASLEFAHGTMRAICLDAYRASIAIAREKPSFADFRREPFLGAPFVQALPAEIRDGIARHGIRNSHLLAIAPAGSISLLAGNVSSGIEPIFAADSRRTVPGPDGATVTLPLTDYAVRLWRAMHDRSDGVPDALVTAADLPLEAHLAMQAVLQPWVDNAISKTINFPAAIDFAAFSGVYRHAYDKGLKGCTVFRAAGERGSVLMPAAQPTCDGGDCG